MVRREWRALRAERGRASILFVSVSSLFLDGDWLRDADLDVSLLLHGVHLGKIRQMTIPASLSYLEAVDGVGSVLGDVADAVRTHPGVLALHITVLVLALHAALVVGELIVGHRETELVRLWVLQEPSSESVMD
ncbi:hypothetical protein E2C01_017306 [Portunus trituberculatus]|uniref:Uncharacterized protein n=1 Tax=Portunus trituberculatus TaxID=210409 RepID=A0A5B7DT42_PORTR|nr:hypothetical protein [Portunus trituberculatus]